MHQPILKLILTTLSLSQRTHPSVGAPMFATDKPAVVNQVSFLFLKTSENIQRVYVGKIDAFLSSSIFCRNKVVHVILKW